MNPKKIIACLATLLFFYLPNCSAGTGGILERPIMLGPQYPLIFMTTAYEPDSAFLMPREGIFAQTSYSVMNAWGYSSNASKDETGVVFEDIDPVGYSVYFDTEIERRFIKFQYGYSDNLELQFTFREINFKTGSLDALVENFHGLINIGNAGRERAEQNQTDIVIHDNETGENIFELTSPTDAYYRESITLGAKYLIRKTQYEALSLSISTNFGDSYIERDVNEVNEGQNVIHRGFNDFNTTIHYSSIFPEWSLHAAYSISFAGNTLFPKSPKHLYYYFMGANWQISRNWDYVLQVLLYSSPFPKSNIANLEEDVTEITTAFRGFLGNRFAMEFGFVENQSQGPQNIDISFFSNLMFYF